MILITISYSVNVISILFAISYLFYILQLMIVYWQNERSKWKGEMEKEERHERDQNTFEKRVSGLVKCVTCGYIDHSPARLCISSGHDLLYQVIFFVRVGIGKWTFTCALLHFPDFFSQWKTLFFSTLLANSIFHYSQPIFCCSFLISYPTHLSSFFIEYQNDSYLISNCTHFSLIKWIMNQYSLVNNQ